MKCLVQLTQACLPIPVSGVIVLLQLHTRESSAGCLYVCVWVTEKIRHGRWSEAPREH